MHCWGCGCGQHRSIECASGIVHPKDGRLEHLFYSYYPPIIKSQNNLCFHSTLRHWKTGCSQWAPTVLEKAEKQKRKQHLNGDSVRASSSELTVSDHHTQGPMLCYTHEPPETSIINTLSPDYVIVYWETIFKILFKYCQLFMKF